MAQEKILREWIDPLKRRIVLHRQTWNYHILTNHPDMGFRLEEVGLTIEKPEVIRRQGPDGLYYRKSSDQLGNMYLKVAVRFRGENDAFVTSSYGVRAIEEKGVIEWVQETII